MSNYKINIFERWSDSIMTSITGDSIGQPEISSVNEKYRGCVSKVNKISDILKGREDNLKIDIVNIRNFESFIPELSLDSDTKNYYREMNMKLTSYQEEMRKEYDILNVQSKLFLEKIPTIQSSIENMKVLDKSQTHQFRKKKKISMDPNCTIEQMDRNNAKFEKAKNDFDNEAAKANGLLDSLTIEIDEVSKEVLVKTMIFGYGLSEETSDITRECLKKLCMTKSKPIIADQLNKIKNVKY